MARTYHLWLLVIAAVASAQHDPNYNYAPYDYGYNYDSYQRHPAYERSTDGEKSSEPVETVHVEEEPVEIMFEESFGGIVPDDVLLSFDDKRTFFADLLEPPALAVNESNPVELSGDVKATNNGTDEAVHEREKRQIPAAQFNQQAAFLNPNLLQQQFDFVQQLPAGLQLGQFQFQDPAQLQLQQHLLQNQQFLQQTLQDQLLQQAQAANRVGSIPLAQQQTANLGQQTAFRASPATGTSATLNSFQTGTSFPQNFQDNRFANTIPQVQQDVFSGIPVIQNVQNAVPLTQSNIPVLQQNVPTFQNAFAGQAANVLRNQNAPQGTVQNQAATAQLFQQQNDAESLLRNFVQNQNAQFVPNNAQFVQSIPQQQQQGFFGQVNSQIFSGAGTTTGEVPRFGFQAANSASFPATQFQAVNAAGFPATQQQQQQQQTQRQPAPQFTGQFFGQQNFNAGFNAQVQQQVPKQQHQQQNGSSVETNSANKTKTAEQAASTETSKVIRDSNAQQASSGAANDNLRLSASGSVPFNAGQAGQPFAGRGPAAPQFGSNPTKIDSSSAQSVNDPLQRQQQQQFQTRPGSNFQGFGGSAQGFGQLPSSFVFVPNVGQPGSAGQDQAKVDRVARSAGNPGAYSNPNLYGKPIKGSIYPVDPANNQMASFIGGIK